MNSLRRLFFRLKWERRGAAELTTRHGVTWIVQPYDGKYTWLIFEGFPARCVGQSGYLYRDIQTVKNIVKEAVWQLEHSDHK